MSSKTSSISLAGLFPPIPTPFKADGQVDYDHLQANVERWNQAPLTGYVVGGSNGEYVFLTPDERVETVRVVRRAAPSNRLVIAGSAMEATMAAIDLTRRMAGAGADVAIVVTPSYYKGRMSAAALEHHYREVAQASPIPVMLYNVPANTGLDMPAQVAINLAAHPNIIGLKESGGDVTKIGFMVRETPADFQILAGSAGFLLGALAVGAVGGVVALANVAAAKLAEMLKCFQQGDLAAARAIQLPLIEANTALTARFGVPGLKAAMDMLGYYGGPVRSPLLPLSEDDKTALRGVLVKTGLL
ncbi:MAG: dihydrodipicolinate synthase family protein [Chloroflexi bacterium]|nr:dihydrodipicolinate synthase family protein [Chloroflexota bacterium]